MPDYDLQGMVAGRVANQDVDMLRIANQTVWESGVEAPLYTIFEGADVSGTTSHNDTPTNSWLAQYFEKYAGPALEIVELGIYVPVGGSIIGQTGKIGIQYNATFFNGSGSYANAIPGATDTTFSTPLVAGWNWVPFTTPLAWTDSLPHILGAYSVGTHYLFNSTLTAAAIGSPSGLFELNAGSAAGGNRSWYAPGTAGNLFSETSARFYGIDIRVREA